MGRLTNSSRSLRAHPQTAAAASRATASTSSTETTVARAVAATADTARTARRRRRHTVSDGETGSDDEQRDDEDDGRRDETGTRGRVRGKVASGALGDVWASATELPFAGSEASIGHTSCLRTAIRLAWIHSILASSRRPNSVTTQLLGGQPPQTGHVVQSKSHSVSQPDPLPNSD